MRASILLLLLAAVPVRGQTPPPSTAPPATAAATATTIAAPTPTTLPSEEEEPTDVSFTSPQSTMRGFLMAGRAADWTKAATYLDLRRVARAARDVMGPLYARQLMIVLDRTVVIDVDALSDSPDGDRDDGLKANRERVAVIKTPKGNVDLVLERLTEPDGSLAWKISTGVVSQIPDLYTLYGDGPLVAILPEFMVDVTVLELRLWQWMALGLLLGAGLLLGWLATGPLLQVLSILIPQDRRHQSARLLGSVAGPIRLFVIIAVVSAALPFLRLSVPAFAAMQLLRKTATTVAIMWLGVRMVDVIAAIADARLRIHGRAGAVSVIPLGRRSLKIFVAMMAAVVIVQNLGYDATGILAGLGVGGLALALAAQKTVENLFGGVVIITDQPVRVGDLCRFGQRTGTVEDIGLRSTRLRTPERTMVSIPHSEFASGQIENLSLRDRMQLLATIGLRLDTTPAQLGAVLTATRALLDAVPKIEKATTSVRFTGITASAFEVTISGYVQTRDWNEFLAIREDFFLNVVGAVEAAGTALTGTGTPPAPAPATPATPPTTT
jgi:MscS family membrane protein